MMNNDSKSKDELNNQINNEKSPNKNKKRFDVDLICKAFEEFNSEETLTLDHYIRGYKELSK